MKSDYDVSSLEQGIVRAKANIKVFEDAITKEHETIKEYYRMIDVINKKKMLILTKEE